MEDRYTSGWAYRVLTRSLVYALITFLSTAMPIQADDQATPQELQDAGWYAPDGASFQALNLPWMSGHPIYCSGVPFKMDYSLGSVAETDNSVPVITVNPLRLFEFNAFWQAFIIGHECGHVYLNTSNEYKADCFAVLTGLQQGWISASQFSITYAEFVSMKRDYDHPPGLKRWVAITRDVNDWSQGALTPSGCGNRNFGDDE